MHRNLKSLIVSALWLGMSLVETAPLVAQSARLKALMPTGNPSGLDPAQSAALFVGVRHFTHDKSLASVEFAVDDAVDLAFIVALDIRVRLVEPGKVVLALSGEPYKEQSKQKLNRLKEAGALVRPAGQSDVLSLLERQAQSVGRNGALIVALATHGFTDAEGTHYMAAEATLLKHRETALSENKILDIASRSEGVLSLVLLDACRERLTRDSKGVGPDPRSAASVLRVDARGGGQAILYAATPGNYAYDDPDRNNGVFSAAIADGLRCAAGTDDAGFVTVGKLATYVDDAVSTWGRKHNMPGAANGIQRSVNETTSKIPLASCGQGTPARTPPVRQEAQPARVTVADRFFDVFSADGIRLWTGEAKGHISQAEVADLLGDGKNEVVVGVAEGGSDTGWILVFDEKGRRLWSANTTMPFNYPEGGHGSGSAVTALATGDLFQKGNRQIVVLSVDDQGWFQSLVSVFDSDGALLSHYWHPGHLRKVAIGSPSPERAPRIIVSGRNNSFRRTGTFLGCVFMLDPRGIKGEAPPYTGNAGGGSEVWYGVLTPDDQSIARLELGSKQDGTATISVWTDTGYVHQLDFEGHLTSTGRTDWARGASEFHLIREVGSTPATGAVK